ncbi:MAG: class I SAM-dependent methyltransferase [Verrucomicrobia bacterium]|nr:class I SAM-dependent methyltransferase [Verrucomicrobiota bacterium]
MKIDYTRYYLKWHADTEEHRAATRAFYTRILKPHLPPDRKARMLDVGCGMGFALLALRELGYPSVSGVDCDEGQVAAAQAQGLDVQLVNDTAAHLRARAGQYDTILALDVIEHVPVEAQLDFVAALGEALAMGGRLICTVPNANSAVAARWRYNDWTHHSSFTEHSLDFLLFNGGFNAIETAAVEFVERPPRAWWPRGGVRHWWAFRFFRSWRRLELMAELGPEQGRSVPMSLNLLAVASSFKRRPCDCVVPTPQSGTSSNQSPQDTPSNSPDSCKLSRGPAPSPMRIDYSRIYRKWHSDAPEHIRSMTTYYRWLLSPHLPADPSVRILDIGCGMGFALLALKEAGFTNVAGVESDQSQAESCRAKGLAVDLTDDTVAYLRARRGSHQTVLALDLIEHIPVPQQLDFVRAIVETLKPGGSLICTVPNANSTLAERYRYICWTHHCSFTEHSLDFLLFNAGFRDIKVLPYDAVQRPGLWWLPVGGSRFWWAFRFVRAWRRLQMMAELGPAQGRGVPLSLNLLGIART